MKVLGIVGSPREGGNTEHLVRECLKTISTAGIEVEIVTLHDKEIGPCNGCGICAEIKNECAVDDDFAGIYDKVKTADGLVVGSPVYFGSATSQLMALLQRLGYVVRCGDDILTRKVGAPIVVARRAGQNFTLAQINYFFFIMGMIVPGSTYWNIAFGRDKGEAMNDTEGLETIRTLGENIAWLLDKIHR